MSKTLILFFFFLLSHLLYSQCPVGNVNLLTQNQVDDFIVNYPTCEIIDGDLIIGSSVTNISVLTSIKRIEGSLRILGSEIVSISNFDDLDFIGGDLEITDTSELIEINGFINLISIGNNLRIHSNNINTNGLVSITGFGKLQSVGGDLSIDNNLVLITVSGFQNLTSIGDWLVINHNDSLQSIPKFEELLSVLGRLEFWGNDSLISIEGFHKLETIGGIIGDNDGGDLNIKGNGSLISIIGFEKLEKIYRHFSIAGNNITTIPLFNALETIGAGFEVSNTGIIHLSGFDNLTFIGSWFTLIDNNNLTMIDGFNNLILINGVVQIITNNALESIIGLNSLTTVGGLMQFNFNPSLTALTGLENLIDVGSRANSPSDYMLLITGNISLTDCSAICNLLALNGVAGLIQISGNPSMCSSQAEIEQDCIPDFDGDDILNDDDLDDDNDGILDIVEQNGDLNRDSDNDNYPDHQDLDSDNDGCFDVIEAGFTDNDQNGTLGSLPDSVDVNGLIISNLDGYTVPLDNNADSIFDFQQANILGPGEDGNLEICITSTSVDLFDSLTGTPDTGGVWTPSLTSGTGIFDPSIDTAGIYTYTVNNGVCGSDASEVNVTITNVTPISDYEIKIKEFSSNNSLEVIIDSNLEYEFSIDGINYQSSNLFSNLTGGDYIIYVQEVNGCGILETMASILDYPKFFTPNNDGFNDFWNLKGKTNKNYSIYIFDRYGKLLKHLMSPESSWDGTYNGNQLPTNDYWFKVVFIDGTVKSGHFTLKK